MDELNKKIEIYNYPSKIDEVDDEINRSFINELSELIKTYRFTEKSGFESINVGLVYNKIIPKSNRLDFNPKLGISVFNYPDKSNSIDIDCYWDQEGEDSVFRARLDKMLKKYKITNHNLISSVDIVIAYNTTLREVGLEQYIKSENKENDEFPDFISQEPRHSLDRIVLNESILDEIKKALSLIKNRNIIYEEWGFKEIDAQPKAVLNFYGPPGTGKTMTAHGIADFLGSKIMALNYSEIESKFVGDAPKKLVKAFETAKREKCLLFFDEADSFLGKRITNVSSSSDQAVNSLRSQMLIMMEEFEGIMVFATNLVTNYDRAFESRILKHIKFELPNVENRKKIISKTIPSKVPFENDKALSNEELGELAKISEGLSGREIKNAVLDSLCSIANKEIKKAEFFDFKVSFKKIKENINKVEQERGVVHLPTDVKKNIET